MQKKNPQNNRYRCYYCEKWVSLKELLDVDELIHRQDSEDVEFIYDNLRKREKEITNVIPYIHSANVGYEVVNICNTCWEKAEKRSREF